MRRKSAYSLFSLTLFCCGCSAANWQWEPAEDPVYLRPLTSRLEDRDFRATGNFYRPRASNGDAPGVLLLHGTLEPYAQAHLHGLCMALAARDLPILRLDVSAIQRKQNAREPISQGPFEMGMSALSRLQIGNMVRRKYIILAATPDQISTALALRKKLYYDCVALVILTGAPISGALPSLPLALNPYPGSLLIWAGGLTEGAKDAVAAQLPGAVTDGNVAVMVEGDWNLESIKGKPHLAEQFRIDPRLEQAMFSSITRAVAQHHPRPRK